jgi:hypothetical protein
MASLSVSADNVKCDQSSKVLILCVFRIKGVGDSFFLTSLTSLREKKKRKRKQKRVEMLSHWFFLVNVELGFL